MSIRAADEEEGAQRSIPTFAGNAEDLRAMKRALARAPLGPKATLALTSAIIALDEESDAVAATHPPASTGLRAPRPRRSA